MIWGIHPILGRRFSPQDILAGTRHCSADWQSAVSPIGNRRTARGPRSGLSARDTADCQSALLLYSSAVMRTTGFSYPPSRQELAPRHGFLLATHIAINDVIHDQH